MRKLLLSVSMVALVSGQIYAAAARSHFDDDLRSHTTRRLPMQFEKDVLEKGKGKKFQETSEQDNVKLDEEPKIDISQASKAPAKTSAVSGEPKKEEQPEPDISALSKALVKKDSTRDEDKEEEETKTNQQLVFKTKEAALKFVDDLKEALEYQRKVASGEIIEEDDPHYTQKMALSYAKKAGWAAFDFIKPALISGGTRVAVNGLVDLFGPMLVDAAGSAGGTLAGKATSCLTNWDSSGTLAGFAEWFGRTQARGETLRHMGDLANAMEIYGPGALLSALKTGKLAVNGTKAAYNKAKGALLSQDSTDVADANNTLTPGYTVTKDGEEETYSFNNLDALVKFHEEDEKAEEYKRKVKSWEIIESDDPDYTKKMILSYASKGAWTAFDIAKPVLFPMGTHILVNGVLSIGGPLLVDVAGDLSRELVVRGGAYITGWNPTGKLAGAAGWAARKQACC